jgi:transcription initiation factor IIE alpha subunit
MYTSSFRCPVCNSPLSPNESDEGYCDRCESYFCASANDRGVVHKSKLYKDD